MKGMFKHFVKFKEVCNVLLFILFELINPTFNLVNNERPKITRQTFYEKSMVTLELKHG